MQLCTSISWKIIIKEQMLKWLFRKPVKALLLFCVRLNEFYELISYHWHHSFESQSSIIAQKCGNSICKSNYSSSIWFAMLGAMFHFLVQRQFPWSDMLVMRSFWSWIVKGAFPCYDITSMGSPCSSILGTTQERLLLPSREAVRSESASRPAVTTSQNIKTGFPHCHSIQSV